MIASEDANRWNLLAVERLAEIGRLEALSSLADESEPLEPMPEVPVDESEPLEDAVLPIPPSEPPVDQGILEDATLPITLSELPVDQDPLQVNNVGSLPLAASEPPKEEAIAAPNELITATELAQILRVHQSSVSRAAKEDHESFKKWSSDQKGSAGRTWDFILVKKGGKEVPQFFQVTDTPGV